MFSGLISLIAGAHWLTMASRGAATILVTKPENHALSGNIDADVYRHSPKLSDHADMGDPRWGVDTVVMDSTLYLGFGSLCTRSLASSPPMLWPDSRRHQDLYTTKRKWLTNEMDGPVDGGTISIGKVGLDFRVELIGPVGDTACHANFRHKYFGA